MGNVAISIGDWSRFVLFHLNAYQNINPILLDPVTLQKLHTPPNSATWMIGGLESWLAKTIYGLDPKTLSYAFGWATKDETEGNYLLWHDGQGSSFSARVEADPKTKSAILMVTNARVDLSRLKKAAKKVRKYYAAKTNLPNHFVIP